MIPGNNMRGRTLAALMSIVIGACAGDAKQDALATDSALERDLARAGQDSLAMPQLQDVAAKDSQVAVAEAPPRSRPQPKVTPTRPKPPAVTPAPAPAPTRTATGNTIEKGTGVPAATTGTVASGTMINLDAVNQVCTNTNKIGDRFTATVSEAVAGSNGVSIPAGADVTLELTELKRSDNTNDQIVMGFRVISVSFGGKTYPLDADVQTATIDRIRASSTGNDAKKVAGGAAVGAIVGQVLGKNRRGTLIGAAVGAAAGAAAAAATANYEGCVNAGADIVVKLNAPVTVATS